MTEILSWIGAVSGAIALGLFYMFKNGAQKYVDAKAQNLATIEDVAKITGEVEAVKASHLRQSHAWKWIFEKEYEILRNVWDSTWEFQATARSLRPIMDQLPLDKEKQKEVFIERHGVHVDSVRKFRDMVIKNQPFIPPFIYEKCLELRSIVIELQVDFEMTFDGSGEPDWKKIHECGKNLDDKLAELNAAIRKHVHGVIQDAQQGVQPDAYGAG